MRNATLLLLAATIGLSACGGRDEAPPSGNSAAPAGPLSDNAMVNMASNAMTGPGAEASLQTAQGTPAGMARVTESGGALRVSLTVEGLPPGEHGVHIHMTGKCEAPGFESAGSHWNPSGKKHGLESPQGQHAGDMPNLIVGEDGHGTVDYVLKGGTLAELLDSDGAAFVVHAGRDDQKTDPSGDSGGRIACGVFHATPG